MTREYEIDVRIVVTCPERAVDAETDHGDMDRWLGQIESGVRSAIDDGMVFGIHPSTGAVVGLCEGRMVEYQIVGRDGMCTFCGGWGSRDVEKLPIFCARCAGSGDVPPFAHAVDGTNNEEEFPMLTTKPVAEVVAGDEVYLAEDGEPGLFKVRHVASNRDEVTLGFGPHGVLKFASSATVEVPYKEGS